MRIVASDYPRSRCSGCSVPALPAADVLRDRLQGRVAFVAVPLWQAGTLGDTPTGEIASTFLVLSLLAAVVPWVYAWRTYVAWVQRVVDARPSPRDAGHFPQSAAASAAQ